MYAICYGKWQLQLWYHDMDAMIDSMICKTFEWKGFVMKNRRHSCDRLKPMECMENVAYGTYK